MGDDLQNREALVQEMTRKEEEISAATQDRWEKVHVAIGFAEYDPEQDSSVSDTMRRADMDMYENKKRIKTTINGCLNAIEQKCSWLPFNRPL